MMTSSVIIDSIGTAKPVASKILSDAFEIPQELITKLIYGAPSVLLHKVDKTLAEKATTTLSQLGLEVSVQDASVSIPVSNASYEISVYIEDIEALPTVTRQVSEFLGCSLKEAFHLLAEPSGIVLGNVSKATVDAFSKRVDARVVASQVAKDTYTITVQPDEKLLQEQISKELNTKEYPFINISYSDSQHIWRKYGTSNKLTICNESHLRYELLLEKVTTSNPRHKETLMTTIGMPEEIIDTVLTNLPVQLEEGITIQEAITQIETYKATGLHCACRALATTDTQVHIDPIIDLEATRNLLSQFITEDQLPSKEGQSWSSPFIKKLIARYIESKLIEIQTSIEITA
ncbi:hypothetical protein [uncultured Dokdonia sp.]|uniref:hypothetical protein n=1 Tax=uncultured Dokdonia sp. TaxID=575653 RepID=UPI00261498E3|nr:hypothetical protein [uncultured Dokdonia sp.]